MIDIFKSFFQTNSIPKSFKLGPETQECIKFFHACKAYAIEGKLKATWTHISNENSNNSQKAFGIVQKAMGKIPGSPDYVFLGKNKSCWIEFKSEKGKLSENQKLFQEWCNFIDVPYYVVKSITEAENILIEIGLLKK